VECHSLSQRPKLTRSESIDSIPATRQLDATGSGWALLHIRWLLNRCADHISPLIDELESLFDQGEPFSDPFLRFAFSRALSRAPMME
jgi:hypothetical protein